MGPCIGAAWGMRGGGGQSKVHSAPLGVTTACPFLQVTFSRTSHQASPCPVPTSPSTCGLTRSSSVRALASDLQGAAGWKPRCMSVYVCLSVCLWGCRCLLFSPVKFCSSERSTDVPSVGAAQCISHWSHAPRSCHKASVTQRCPQEGGKHKTSGFPSWGRPKEAGWAPGSANSGKC